MLLPVRGHPDLKHLKNENKTEFEHAPIFFLLQPCSMFLLKNNCFMPALLITWEAVAGRSQIQDQPGLHNTNYLKSLGLHAFQDSK
jgi:hypothetical protein